MNHKPSSNAQNKGILKKLLKEKNLGVKIDLGCGANKNTGFIGVDVRPLPGVDIVADLEKFPWPIPSECASLVVCSHVLEHVNPMKVDARIVSLIDLLLKKKLITEKEKQEYIGETDFESIFIRFMDEVWRILKPGGEFMFSVPYAGSGGFYQDPTHINNISFATLFYFDPFHDSKLYTIYRPKPWKIEHQFYDTGGIMEVHLIKRREDKSFSEHVNFRKEKS